LGNPSRFIDQCPAGISNLTIPVELELKTKTE